MNQIVSNKQKTMKCKTQLMILSLVALLGAFFSGLSHIITHNPENGFLTLSIRFPHIIELISWTLTILPCIFLLLFVIKLYNDFNPAITVSLILILIALQPIYSFIINILFNRIYPVGFFDFALIPILFAAAICIITGFHSKVVLIIASIVGLLLEIPSIYYIIRSIGIYLRHGIYFTVFCLIIQIIGIFSLYITILLYGLNNDVSPINTKPLQNAPTENTAPEQALILLNKKRELGTITEEEYQSQRAEIISKL